MRGPSPTSALPSLLLRLGIKLSVLIKLKRHWLWPETPISYAAVGPKCFGTSYDGTCLFLSFSLHAFSPLMHSINFMLSDFPALSWLLLFLSVRTSFCKHLRLRCCIFLTWDHRSKQAGVSFFVCWFPELNNILLALKGADIVASCLFWIKCSCVLLDSDPRPT